jgi:hypothetical protein
VGITKSLLFMGSSLNGESGESSSSGCTTGA